MRPESTRCNVWAVHSDHAGATLTNSTEQQQRQRNHRRALLIAMVLFVSYAYFYAGGGWNQNSRFDLIRAIIEQGTLRIDAYHQNTRDKAFFRGHYYSDKAPGLALLAVPIVAAARPVLRAAGVDPGSPRGLVGLSYLATVFTLALPAALATACLFLVALRLGATVAGAVFAALSLGLATPMWAYTTALFGHALAGACLLFSFAAALGLRQAGSPMRDLFLGLAVGVAAGWATVTEYPAAPAAAVLALLALAQAWPGGWARRSHAAGGIAIGALGCVAVLMLYQYAAFGSPFDLGYSHYQEGVFPWMDTGFHGLTYPRPLIMARLLLDPYLGLFLLSTVVAAAPLGLRLLWKQANFRSFAVVAAIIPAYYLCFNASFFAWRGGSSYGPRYMLAGIPVLCIGLAPVWSSAGRGVRWLLAMLAICGITLSLMAVSTTILPPQTLRCPIVQLIWPSFWAGRMSINSGSIFLPKRTHEAFNLGELAGLHGLASLVPLLAIWAGGAFVWMRIHKDSVRSRASLQRPISPDVPISLHGGDLNPRVHD